MKRWPAHLVLGLALLGGIPAAHADDPAPLTPAADDTPVSRDARLVPGVHRIEDANGNGVLQVTADGVTLDLGGATLLGAPEGREPDAFSGAGIAVEGVRNVTIRNGRIQGFRVAIRARNAPGLVIEDVDASGNFKQRLGSTPEREDPADWLWPHENDHDEWETRYGAGFSLTACERATVRRCRVRRGQNGLLLTRCTGCFAYDNDFSFNSGWGVALYRTTRTEVSHNRLDFCVRGYSHGVYYRGQDSAAILVFEQSSGNVFAKNSATHSGDGFFLYAGHETTQRTGEGGSNVNAVIENDFAFAVANGIEATFSRKNIFEGNDCSGCDHGVWAGYSYDSVISDNRLDDCMSAGVSIEHGHGNVLAGNHVHGGRYGIHLWWDDDKDFLAGPYGRNQRCDSADNSILLNTFESNGAAIRLDTDTNTSVLYNTFAGERTRVEFAGTARLGRVTGNTFPGELVVANGTGATLSFPANPAGGLRSEGDEVRPADEEAFPPPLPPPPLELPPLRGSMDVSWPEGMPRGREQMRIDEWGPLDPRETRLFPAHQAAAGGEARFHLLGSGAFRAQAEGDVVVTPSEGRAPATIVVRAADGGPAYRTFRLETAMEGGPTLTASGSLLRIPWTVSYFVWDDASDPLAHPEAFAALLTGEPAQRDVEDGLDLPWRGGGPEGVAPDRFATLATASLDLPAGRFALRVTSDDGVRVFLDGRKVIERWDRHGPTEDVAEVELAAGRHELRVEHFEIDGWAWLAFRLEPR